MNGSSLEGTVKRLWLLPTIIGLLFSGVPLRAQQADLRPDYGVLNGRRYMNGYFGFSYRFPEGWNGSALRYPAVGESKMYPLFSANPQAASTSDVRYVSINADYLSPNTTVKAPKDFLEIAVNAQAGPGGEFEALHTDKRYLYGGKQFYRVDMKARPSPGNPVFYQTLICTILRGYAITFSFMAANDDDMEDLVRSMESLSFAEPGQITSAPTAVASQQAPSASSSTNATAVGRAPSTLVPATTESRPSANAVQSQPVQPATLPETAAAPPTAAAAPPKTTRRATATVSSSASEIQTAEIPLNQVASNMPVTVEADVVAPAPAATITAAPSTVTNSASSSEIAPARSAPASAPSRSGAPSTLISLGRTPQNAYPAASESAPKVQAANTTVPATQTTRAETPAPAPAPPPPSTLPQPAGDAVNSAPMDTSRAKLQPAAEMAASQPTAQPVVERAPEPTPAPASAASATPAVASTGKSPGLTRIYVPPAELDQYILRKTPPVYPMIAKAAGVGGMVVLDIIVDGKGNLLKVTTITGSALLARAAEEALRQWRFKPYLIDGNPVEMESQIAMNFRLTK
jgi:protein TonB